MRILIVGANSYVGQSVTSLLHMRRYQVSALARSADSVIALNRRGVCPLTGEIMDVAGASSNLRDYDACIWLSFLPLKQEQESIRRLLAAIEGSQKTFIFTSGTGVLGIPSRLGEWSEQSFAEDDPFAPPPWLATRRETEKLVLSGATRGLRAMIVRPPLIWGKGGSRQVPWIFETAAKTGRACYVGRGLNVYSHVNVEDLAELYLRALEHGVAGAVYHAVAGEENFRSIADAVASVMGCESAGISFEAMADLLGRAVTETAFAMNSRSRCPRSRSELGWEPTRVDLIEDIRGGSYRQRFGT